MSVKPLVKKAIGLSAVLIIGWGLCAGGQADRALAGQDNADLINYSFATWLGSGVYRVRKADKEFAVLRVPLSYTLREAEDYRLPLVDRIGWKLLLPVVVAYQKETESNNDYGASAFVPGLEVQIPLTKYWTLKPFAQFGAGKDTSGGSLDFIYGGGARSLVSIPWHQFVVSIGNTVLLTEERNADTKETVSYALVNAGLDVRYPTQLQLFERKLDVSGYFIYNAFKPNRVELLREDGNTKRIKNVYEAGLTLGVERPVSIWKFGFDRIGIDYRWGSKGLKGIGFNMGFPF